MLQASIDGLRRENERLRGLLGYVDASDGGRGAEKIATAATETGAGAGTRSDAGSSEEVSQTRTISMSDIHPRTGLGGNGAELSPGTPGAALSQSSKLSSACFDRSVSYNILIFHRLCRRAWLEINHIIPGHLNLSNGPQAFHLRHLVCSAESLRISQTQI